jgi:hypothetical protein
MPNKHKKHRVIIYNWIRGILHFEELLAESLEHAIFIAKECTCYMVKVYDCDNILVHSMHGHKDYDHDHDHNHYA